MNDPDAYEVNKALGLSPPIPWYYAYFQAADRCNCSPWELIDEPTPKRFWVQAALIVADAEAEHARFKQEQQNKQTAGAAVTPGALG